MKRLIFSYVSVFALVMIFSATSSAAEKVRFATAVKGNVNYDIPMLVAEEKNFWPAHGLQVEWAAFRSSVVLQQAIASQAVDMALSSVVSFIQGASRGVPAVIVADARGNEGFSLWVRSDSRIREPKDLKGARLGVTRLGSSAHAYGRALAKALRLEKEIRFVAGGGLLEEIAAIKAGSLDGRFGSFITLSPLAVAGEVRELVAGEEFLPRPWSDLVIAAHKEFLAKKPEAVKGTSRALIESMNFMLKNESWTVEKIRAVMGFPEKTARAVFKRLLYSPDGKIDPRAIENVRNFLLEYEIIPREKAPPLEQLYAAGLVP